MTDYEKEVWGMLIANRGGIPANCDFCGQPYGPDRHPVPEEAQAWACSDCERRWEAEAKALRCPTPQS